MEVCGSSTVKALMREREMLLKEYEAEEDEAAQIFWHAGGLVAD